MLAAVAMLLSGAVPAHAHRPRHLSFLWPFLGLSCGFWVALVRFSERVSALIAGGLGLVLSSASLLSTPRRQGPPVEDFSGCRRLVVPGNRRLDVLFATFG